MESLLPLFVGLTALAVITQACVLVAIYLMSKRLSGQVERFMKESREMMVPLKAITENLQTASTNIAELGESARDQFRRVEAMVIDTSDVLHTQLDRLDQVSRNVVERINDTADIVQDTVLRPVREIGAIARGLRSGFEALFSRRKRKTVNLDEMPQDEELVI